ncbi:hypothetical protein [Bradyrhizobium sp. CB3481]|uniref:hypothetical protein n=1 Tax=Bradyrhizobium sp. CB3481 TaxID=3039158 RepID=UPI0024B1E1B6|nr:hypothetical protein [Bradyrhizobium sp. CB3481]WFU18069.1 hypothetical protein QA643_06925 [Bradyrhizobium sp. CB3481]
MRIIDLAVALIFFIASAGVAAFLMAVFIHYGLGVPPAALRIDALISAGILGLLLIVTAVISKD